MKINYPTKKLGVANLKTLALTKAVYLRGCSLARNNDEVSRMLAIHIFDNTVEMTLKLIAKTKRVASPKKDSWEFYDLLNKTYENDTFIIQISELHKQRNQVQHAGDIPGSETVNKYQIHVEDFLEDVCQKEFSISYKEISLASLITDSELQELFKKAEQAFRKEEYKKSIEYFEDVFCRVVFDTADIFSKAGVLTGYFNGGDELGVIIKDDYAEKYKNSDYHEFAKEVSRAFLQLGMSSTAMQFFDEYRIDFLNHRRRVDSIDSIPKENLKDEAQKSLDFMLNIILKWQEEKIL